MATGAQTWSTTAASNNSVDSSVNWAEGMAPSAVNNSARAEMASVAMWIGDNSGTLLTSGSTTAYTVTSKQVSTAVVDGYTIAVRFHAANDASATLNVDGVAAKAIELYAGQALVGGEFQAGSVARFTYTSSSTSWVLNNFPRLVGTVTSPVGFQITSTSTSVPGYSFSGDTNTGVYWPGADTVGVLCGGTNSVTFSSDGATIGSSLAAASVTASSAVSGATVTGSMVATQANQETGTATNLIVTPGRQHFHQSAAKAWIKCDAAGNISASYNITGITDTGVGTLDVTIATDFSGAHYAIAAQSQGTSNNHLLSINNTTPPTAGTFRLSVVNAGTAASNDPDAYHAACFGDQA